MPEPTSPSVAVRRVERGHYDRETINHILDETFVCHVGLIDDHTPVVIPMFHIRIEDDVILHGAHPTRLFRVLATQPRVCVTATILDGLVLARSAFNHSANYRSVVAFGQARPVEDLAERRRLLDLFTERVVPGRRPYLRPMTDKEVRTTAVVRVRLEEASAKVRSGPPVDEDEDYGHPVWAGVLPVRGGWGPPQPDPRNLESLEVPSHVRRMVAE